MLNQCYQKKHKLSFTKEVAMDDPEMEKTNSLFQNYSTNENGIVNRELGDIIENAIHEMPEDYRLVFTLRELNGLSVLETAESLDISENNVKVRFSRAKTMLRLKIRKMYSTQEIFDFNKNKNN